MTPDTTTMPDVAAPCPSCSRYTCRCDEPAEWTSSSTPWCEAFAANA